MRRLRLFLFILILSLTFAACGGMSPTAVGGTPSSAVLGADISAFIAAYGYPTANNGQGTYTFSNGASVLTLEGTNEPAQYKKHVFDVSLYPPQGSSWTADQAQAMCKQFAPSDAQYQKTEQSPNPYGSKTKYVYVSAQLATQLPKDEWDSTGRPGNPITPGTFSIRLTFSNLNPNNVNSCDTSVVSI